MRSRALIPASLLLAVVASGDARSQDREARIAVATAAGRIALVDADGRRVATLAGRAGWEDTDPAWSPDGTRIVFTRTKDGYRSFQIYVARADGSGARRITRGRFDFRPAWSPDGRWIAYQSVTGLRRVRPDGSGSRLVPHAGRFASDPAWTPDGRIAYAFHAEEPVDWPASCRRPEEHCGWVWTSRLDGSSRRAVVRGREPRWAPDGRRIVYTRPTGGVAVVAASGGRSRLLGRGHEPDWSPDGTRIVYARLGDDAQAGSVWIMDREGSHARRIVQGATDPAWRPR